MSAPVGGSAPSLLRRLLVHGPRGPFRWTAYVLGVTAFAAAVPTPLYPTYEHQFHFSAGILGLMFAAYTPGVLLTLFFIAPQAERVGRSRMLSLGMAFTALGSVTFALANGVLWLAVARVVSGLAVGATSSVATAAMSDLEPYRDPHHVARVAVAANFGGFAVGVVGSGFLVEYAPHPTQLIYLLPILGSALGWLALRVVPETATAAGSNLPLRVQRISVPPELERPFWVAAGGIAACYAIYGLFAALVPSYVRGTLGLASPLAAGAIVGLMFGLAALVQLATSQLRDRRALLIGFPLLVGALVVLVEVLLRTEASLLVLASAALGIAVGLTYMGSVTLVDRVAPEGKRGEMLAGFYCAGYLALAVPTIGVAELSERIGLTNAGIEFGAILAVAVVLLLVAVSRTPTPPGGGGRPRDLPGTVG
ncbi:MAG TPA: MFS transporter [Thermoplasmata archaeon]|nr:MFS transporter [Thermoplasmata archaeon]